MPWSYDEEQRWLWDNIDENYHDQMIIMIMLKMMLKGWLWHIAYGESRTDSL